MLGVISKNFLVVALSVLLSWIISNLLKPVLNKDVSWREVFSTDGGMPSAHTTPASALVFSIFLVEGFSISLVIAVVFLIALMRDAVGVRYTVGNNAVVLKRLVKNKDEVIVTKGHTFKQVMVGFFIGLFTSLVVYWVLI